jgi:signal transduction histidine kinase
MDERRSFTSIFIRVLHSRVNWITGYWLVFCAFLSPPCWLHAQINDSTYQHCNSLYQQGQYDYVIDILQKGMPETAITAFSTSDIPTLLLLSEAYLKTGDTAKAFRAYNLYSNLRDTLILQQKNRFHDSIENLFRTAEKETEIIERQLQIDQSKPALYRRNIWIWGITVCSLGLISVVLLLINAQNKKQKILQQQEQQAARYRQIEKLNIQLRSEREERKRIFERLKYKLLQPVDDVYQRIETLLYKSGSNASSIEMKENLEHLESVKFEVQAILQKQQQLKDSDNLLTSVQTLLRNLPEQQTVPLSSSGDPSRAGIVVHHEVLRIVQEFIHNTMKHGSPGHASIELHFHAAQLEGLLSNAGTHPATKGPQGLGLESIQLRVRQLGGRIHFQYKDPFSIHFFIPYGASDVGVKV